jgi:hypothetical protein
MQNYENIHDSINMHILDSSVLHKQLFIIHWPLQMPIFDA